MEFMDKEALRPQKIKLKKCTPLAKGRKEGDRKSKKQEDLLDARRMPPEEFHQECFGTNQKPQPEHICPATLRSWNNLVAGELYAAGFDGFCEAAADKAEGGGGGIAFRIERD